MAVVEAVVCRGAVVVGSGLGFFGRSGIFVPSARARELSATFSPLIVVAALIPRVLMAL
jgi:hypothetical protein